MGHLRRGPVLCPESASALSVTYGAERLPVEVQRESPVEGNWTPDEMAGCIKTAASFS